MPRLRELNIHLGVALSGILEQGQLPTVTTLSVPINQFFRGFEATSIIRACPNVTLLRLNLDGDFVWATRGNGPCLLWDSAERALEAAAALKSLRDLEMFKFSSNYHTEVPENGWLPRDLKGT